MTIWGQATVYNSSMNVFFRMVGDFPEMALEIMRHMARRLGDTTDRLR